jgi:hypothetical protein
MRPQCLANSSISVSSGGASIGISSNRRVGEQLFLHGGGTGNGCYQRGEIPLIMIKPRLLETEPVEVSALRHSRLVFLFMTQQFLTLNADVVSRMLAITEA